ncbi:multidrug transporter [Helcococcus kunzii]|uniref:Multidrug transporter n=1 Tax=Helcococcus kunzii ATCC 51366 TaxID=883114 RepID=H3NQ72_9FIRM|nr:hypothetical protein [Helcococcus kunzii]EHR32552.1 hypothetical protein HMPREF9709_01483 [Helcococcus kunzii ATCC 51366]
MYKPLESDWRLFKKKIIGWQERYMERLLDEYANCLDRDLPVSTKFWALEKRINSDKKKPGVRLMLSRSNMVFDIARLINDGAISIEEISDFSEELKETINFFHEIE